MKEKPKGNLVSHHFSHDHPLEFTSSPPNGITPCFGCNVNILPGKGYYKCKICQFSLHQTCHHMPKKVQHPADPNHHLTLQATLSSEETSIKCKACGCHSIGFNYNCPKGHDLYHILCSAAPLSVTISAHFHRLRLEFSRPNNFECDLCKKPSSSSDGSWLYRCDLCEFDAHFVCAMTFKGAQWVQNQSEIDQSKESKDQSQSQDQLVSIISEDLSTNTPSYQFSDSCFSIDLAKSLLGDHHEIKDFPEVHASPAVMVVNHLPGFDSRNGGPNPKNVTDRAFSTGISSPTWMELEEENLRRKKANGNEPRDRTGHEGRRILDKGDSRRSRLSKFLLCC